MELFEVARKKMVDVDLAGKDIKDVRVLSAFGEVPRHMFVRKIDQDDAYGDFPLSIGYGQTISQPYMVALMTQCLELNGTEKVLEIGTGSGYQTAILAELSKEVYSIERVPELAENAKKTLNDLNYTNVIVKEGDGTIGWPENASYDGIIVTAGAPCVPETLKIQLAEGGRLVIPVGDKYTQVLTIIRKQGNIFSEEKICGCVFVPLIGRYGWK